ncbi:helicase C-terminal domain-containing protein [Roseisolibacter sp. H3M3-2]|uniref:helicase C-terminal domain-containing protein n=1 Tax=Roseisolibacter sp. H3M3-2 TaxID=3031323 RepID=UPI0023D9E484|nr:helicase C-terminal domain-containing protein [Roseisolibacter sp. H3M3-2]MDF1502781.1 helicase C-terminal domain-containing protein [Roseisolibacter sp. H3M3-2]
MLPAALPLSTDGRLSRPAAAAIRAAIALAGGREVCFACQVDEGGVVRSARVVARGDVRSVLALPGFAERGEMLVHNHPSGLLEPSNADLEVASRIFGNGVGFGIVDNAATELYVVVEVPRGKETVDVDPAAIDADLGPDGAIARRLRRYEDRPAQRQMASAIARLFNDGGVGLLEAGTGVGKSMGYLVPALRWAAANGERTVVSTNTINLQEQLVGKDLPFLAEALTDQKVRFALLKGWRNYLCLHRLEQARVGGQALFEAGMAAELGALEAWAERTGDGSVADLATPPRPEVWDEVSAEPDLCQRMKCPHFDRCFLFKARREAAQADVIVVNHHLLLSDVAVRRAQQNWEDAAVLPAYKRLVVDEGHHLEDAAAAHLGTSVTRRALQRLFARLDRRGKGLLGALVARLAEKTDLLSVASLDLVQSRLVPAAHGARDRADLVFDLLQTWCEGQGQAVIRFGPDFARDPIWAAGLDAALTDLLGDVELLHESLRLVRERLESDEKRAEQLAPLLGEVRAVARRLASAGDGLGRALKPEKGDESVRWVELRGKEKNVVVTAVPLDLAPILRDDLFKRVRTAVVTSATLATRDERRGGAYDRRARDAGGAAESFAFLASRLGITAPEFSPATAVFPSPFDYRRQALLVVPTDAPAPNVDGGAHFLHVVRHLLDTASASDGGMFALFTSHRDVREAASELRARGADRRWPLLVHGEDTRDALLRRFRESGRAVLLGTASFWEGVDVPGDALRALILAKVPFRVPSEPVTAAQCEAIEARGGDSFREYMLPHASLRLKQGFGRLVRTAHDRGVVVLADPRVVTKGYGRDLLEGLPPARRLAGPWARLRAEVEAFYAERRADATAAVVDAMFAE